MVVVLAAAGGWYAKESGLLGAPHSDMAVCTMEAKLCPDGSYVGRTGPQCEFAPCPTTASSSPATLEVGIGQVITAHSVSITPLEVLEDSRCPADVQCIQAGTVRVRATVVSDAVTTTQTFILGTPVTLDGETITLAEVRPAKISTHTIQNSDYVFVFTFSPEPPTYQKG